MLKLMDLKIFTILRQFFLFNWIYDVYKFMQVQLSSGTRGLNLLNVVQTARALAGPHRFPGFPVRAFNACIDMSLNI